VESRSGLSSSSSSLPVRFFGLDAFGDTDEDAQDADDGNRHGDVGERDSEVRGFSRPLSREVTRRRGDDDGGAQDATDCALIYASAGRGRAR